MSDESLIELWKKARDSAEHFDKLLSDFRKIAVAVDAAYLPIAVQIYLAGHKSADGLWKWQQHLVFLCFSLNAINYMIWLLEKHYHLYLTVAASVANEAERKIGWQDSLRLTHQFIHAKGKKQFGLIGLHIYDWLYIGPAAAALLFAIYIKSEPWVLWIVVGLALAEIELARRILIKTRSAEPQIWT